MKIKRFFSKITKIIELKDILMVIGTTMVGNGLYMLYPPAMWLIIGGFIIFLAWPRKAVK